MATSNRLRDYAPRAAPRESQFSGGFLMVAAATVLLGIGIGIAGFFWRSSPSQTSVADVVASATARRDTAAPAPLPEADDGNWTDADLRRCGEEAAAAADAASKRKLAAVSADRVGLGAPDPKMVERSAFLLCSTSSKPRHFCQNYWHDRLLGAIKVYVADFRTVSTSAYWTKVSLAERVRADSRANSDELRVMADDIDQTTREVMKMNEEIVAALRALVADGIVEKADFGKFLGLAVPPDIAKLLGDGPALRHVCG
jgi:hypothetical protein